MLEKSKVKKSNLMFPPPTFRPAYKATAPRGAQNHLHHKLYPQPNHQINVSRVKLNVSVCFYLLRFNFLFVHIVC